MNILCDMHVHSQNSHDSVASVLDMANACIKNNIYAFAITDHCDIEYFNEHNVLNLIANSVKETENASKELNGIIKILKGIEIGEGIWNKEYTDKILNSFNFDVIISSVHAVRYKNYTMPYSTIDFSKMEMNEIYEYLDKYFDEVQEMLKNVPCDIMAHLTCPLRYINGKYGLNIDIKRYESKIISILEYIIKNSIALEINTSGIGAAYGQFMPDNWIIKKFKELGGYLITLGSDAHIPKNVGNAFNNAISFLKEYEFTEYYYFENRNKIKINI